MLGRIFRKRGEIMPIKLFRKENEKNEIPFVTTEYFQKAKLSEYQNVF
jgi:hypothetical protein